MSIIRVLCIYRINIYIVLQTARASDAERLELAAALHQAHVEIAELGRQPPTPAPAPPEATAEADALRAQLADVQRLLADERAACKAANFQRLQGMQAAQEPARQAAALRAQLAAVEQQLAEACAAREAADARRAEAVRAAHEPALEADALRMQLGICQQELANVRAARDASAAEAAALRGQLEQGHRQLHAAAQWMARAMQEGRHLEHENARLRGERNTMAAAARRLAQQLAEAHHAAGAQRMRYETELASQSRQLATTRAHAAQVQAQLHTAQHALQDEPVRAAERMDVVRFLRSCMHVLSHMPLSCLAAPCGSASHVALVATHACSVATKATLHGANMKCSLR